MSVLENIGKVLLVAIIACILIISFYPILWMILNSFKSNNEIFQTPLNLPKTWNLSVFATAWTKYKFAPAVMNSIIITTSVVALNLVFSSMAAFATSHLQFIGRNLFLSFCIGCQVVSGQVLLVPLYKLLNDLGIYNTRVGLVLAITAYSIPMSMYLFNGFFKGVPKDVYESSKVDGCHNGRYFLQILLPLSTPIIASVCIFQALFTWNEYLFTLTFLRSTEKWTIPPMLRNLFTGYSQQYNMNFASLSIAVVPILIVYVFLQRYFIRGLTAGSVKG